MIAGMDEAGRGPVIGPLVIGLVIANQSQLEELEKAGVNDSKQLTAKTRERLAKLILATVEVATTLVVPAATIDQLRHDGLTLNEVEVTKFRELLAPYTSEVTILQLDAADVNEVRFGANFEDMVAGKIESKHKGDSLFIAVAAASIMAKVKRDAEVKILQDMSHERDPELPLFGKGYPQASKPFLAAYLQKYGSLPPWVRHSWKTATSAMRTAKHPQKRLDDFL